MTVKELIAELSKYHPDTLVNSFKSDDEFEDYGEVVFLAVPTIFNKCEFIAKQGDGIDDDNFYDFDEQNTVTKDGRIIAENIIFIGY